MGKRIQACGRCGEVAEIHAREMCKRCYSHLRDTGQLANVRNQQRDAVEAWLATVNGTDGCWLWPYGLNKDGYGVTTRSYRQQLVHRVVYELLVGPIPDGMTVDHRCHNLDPECPAGRCDHRRCANPSDLVLATSAANTLEGKGVAATNARKTHCDNRHPLSGGNLYVSPKGYRG